MLGLAWAACATDPVVDRWTRDWLAASRAVEEGHPDEGLRALERLQRTAPTALDRFNARMDAARAYEAMGRPDKAFEIYASEGQIAARRSDRARARHEQAHLAESVGDGQGAVPLYRRIALTYPDLMPGLRALQRLQDLAVHGPPGSLAEHLRWSHAVYEVLESRTLGDNLVYFAGHTAYRAWRATADPKMAAAAERLLMELATEHYLDGLWEEGVWELSWLFRHQGRLQDERWAVRLILRTREKSYLLGSYDTPYHWLGELRLARLSMMELGDPEEAAGIYAGFLDHYPRSRWRDDVRFWQGCAWLRAGRPEAAERAFARIADEWEESKYLKRLDAARADPFSEVCVPVAIDEDMP
ncbi:MAG: tetratricopeptide repeat protein [Deltaproteobacteria bacterium]|nr:tetratricopeptide repeat protein [Deltaproteobacteria bacterium]